MIKIFNNLSRTKEDFVPLNKKEVTMYVCGPTVYDRPHLGHGYSATAFDIIRRYLIYRGFNVKYVSNYTDIDDKMIKRAEEKGISVSDLSAEVIPYYEEDYSKLNIMTPDAQPRATQYIDDVIEIIKRLETKDAVYPLEDGLYFDITAFPEYGKLSGQNLDDLKMGARVAVNDNKRNPQDFAVWKFEKPGEPSWDSPWGKGRPGWHIECSAMNLNINGETIDIHGGGLDLQFPHHECEIAQSEKANGKPFAKYWMHNGFININEEKMSKSLGNFITLNDILQKYSGEIVRYLYLQNHYRSPINFTEDLLDQSKNALARIHDFIRSLDRVTMEGDLSKEVKTIVAESKTKFETSMDDDFETSGALAALFDLIKEVNKIGDKLTIKDREYINDYLQTIDGVFGLIFTKKEEINDDIDNLIKERDKARIAKDWAKADKIRDDLKAQGIELEDLPDGTVWKKV